MVSNVGLIISALIILAATIWVLIVCTPQRKNSTSYRTDINSEVFSTSAKNKSLNSSSSPMMTGGGSAGAGNSPGGSFTHRTAQQPTDQIYPNLSSYYGDSRNIPHGLSPGNESPVYGDTTLISPQKRINRRYI